MGKDNKKGEKHHKYVYNIFKEVPDTRTIYVVLDKDGGKGKTFFQNFLSALHPDEVEDITNRNSKDMLYLVKNGNYKMIQLKQKRERRDKEMKSREKKNRKKEERRDYKISEERQQEG